MTRKSILEQRIYLKKQLIVLLRVEIKSLEEMLGMQEKLEDISPEEAKS